MSGGASGAGSTAGSSAVGNASAAAMGVGGGNPPGRGDRDRRRHEARHDEVVERFPLQPGRDETLIVDQVVVRGDPRPIARPRTITSTLRGGPHGALSE